MNTFQRCHYCELSKFDIFETNRVVHSREVFGLYKVLCLWCPIELSVTLRKRDQRDDSFYRGRRCIKLSVLGSSR